jgi:cytochrome P450
VQYIPFYPTERRLRKAVQEMDEFAYSIIAMKKSATDLAQRQDLLSLCILFFFFSSCRVAASV